jgi:hypothetical protein
VSDSTEIMMSMRSSKKGALALLLLAALCLLQLSVTVHARPVVVAQGGIHGGESKGAKKERLIDMVTAGEASAVLVSNEPAVTAEEETDDEGDAGGAASAAAAAAAAEAEADAAAAAPAAVDAVDADAVDASSTDGGGGDDAAVETKAKKLSVASKFADTWSKYTKPVASKTVSFFSGKYFKRGGAEDAGDFATTQEEPAAAATDADATDAATEAAATAAADAAIAAATSGDASVAAQDAPADPAAASAMSDEELQAVLAQADAAEASGINFVKPPAGANFRDATVRPSSPPPSLAPLSYENMRQHYIVEVGGAVIQLLNAVVTHSLKAPGFTTLKAQGFTTLKVPGFNP